MEALNQHYLTHVAPSSHLESPWLTLHKFLWLNVLTGTQLYWARNLHCFGSQSKIPSQIRSVPFETWLDDAKGPFLEVAVAFQGKKISSVLPAGIEDSISPHVRFCPECLEAGYHSTTFQLGAVSRCPVHGSPLRSACHVCRLPIGRFEFCPWSFKHPMGCPHCKRPFFSSMTIADAVFDGPRLEPSELVRMHLAFGPATTTSDNARSVLRYESNAARSFHFACWRSVTGALPGPVSYVEEIGIRIRPTQQQLRRTRYQVFDSSEEIRDKIARVKLAGQELRALDRHLARQVRAACGHAVPEKLPLIPGYDKRIEHVPLQGRYCPCCVALTWWRAQVGLVFRLIKALDNWPSEFNRLEILHKVSCLVKQVTAADFAQSAHALFCVFANQVSGAVGVKSADVFAAKCMGLPVISEIPRPNESRHSPIGFFQLPVDADALPTVEVLMETATGTFACSFSLESALSGLRQAIRLVGQLRRRNGVNQNQYVEQSQSRHSFVQFHSKWSDQVGRQGQLFSWRKVKTPRTPAWKKLARPPALKITERELAVLHELVRGRSNIEIAESLGLKVSSIKSRLYSLFLKLGVHARADAVAKAREGGIVA